MNILVRISTNAEQDLTDTYLWYENQSPGLGNDFLLCVEATLNQMQRNPESFQLVHRNVRRALLRRFPYGVFYIISNESLVVLAVFHAKRNPRSWQQRS